MASAHKYTAVDVPRREFYGGTNWHSSANWSGDNVPDADDDVFVRNPGTPVFVDLNGTAVAANLNVLEGATISTEMWLLDVGESVTVSGPNSAIYVGRPPIPGGTIRASEIRVENQGLLYVNSLVEVVSQLSVDAASELVLDGGTLRTSQPLTTDADMTLAGNGGTIDVSSPSATLVWQGDISGPGNLIKDGPSALQLEGRASHGGQTNILRGQIRLGANERISDSSPVSIDVGASLRMFTATETIGSLAGSGTVFNDGHLITGGNNSSTTFSGVIDGSGHLTKTGTGQFFLTNNNNTYSGDTNINGGFLIGNSLRNAQEPSSFGQGNFNISNGAVLYLASNDSWSSNRPIELLGDGGWIYTGDSATSTLELNGTISGTGTLRSYGAATLRLNGNNTYSGETQIFGTLQTGGNNRIPDVSRVYVGGRLDINDFDETIRSLDSVATVSLGTGLLTVTDTTIGSTSTGLLNIEIAGPAEADYGRLDVAGGLTLGGSLDVSLVGGFNPQAGMSFNILNFAQLSGSFDSMMLPILDNGLEWHKSQLYTSGSLLVVHSGDFNADGAVNAADYIYWSKFDGRPSEYDKWRANFGQSLGASSNTPNAFVPEPSVFALVLIGGAFGLAARHR
jgi:autotransporter-associated beta strand protein